MKYDKLNKTVTFRTGKNIVDLLESKQKRPSANLNVSPPANENESILYNIWKDLLRHDDFGVKDDFFQIGGNSLKAVQMISRISRQLSVHILLTDIFLQPTISQLSALISRMEKGVLASSHIQVKPRPENIPLSFSQERLWFIDQLEGSVQYHTPDVLRLKGELNINALELSFQTIINRHEALRTVILEEQGRPYQHIKNKDNWNLELVESKEYNHNSIALKQYVDSLIKLPFDLSNDYMIRAHLIKLEAQEHLLVVTMHHIASDGWSIAIFIKELVVLYQSFIENHPPLLERLDIQYADFAIWQRQHLQGELLEKKVKYWKDKLQEVSLLQLPTDYTRPAVQSTKGSLVHFNINKKLTEQLQQFSQQQGATLYMTLLAAFKVLLHRYSGQQDICVGTPIAGRQHLDIENLIGFFVNTIALRTGFSGDISFTELLKKIKTTTLEAYEHHDVPFEKVVEEVIKERDISKSPLFQVLFVLQNTPEIPQLSLGNLILSREDFTHDTSKFDLAFFFAETSNGLEGKIEYCTDLFVSNTIDRMTGHFEEILSSIMERPEQRIGVLNMLKKAEKEELLFKFNDTKVDYTGNKSVVTMFEEQAAKYPDAIALLFGKQIFTYSELNQRANQLAHYLRKNDIREETLVPICIERGPLMVIGLLGILKAGAAYVPIDPEYPFDRISYMLENTCARLVISSERSKLKLQGISYVNILELDVQSTFYNEPITNLEISYRDNCLAYVIYTSGSTGKPKGVMIEQHSLVNLLRSILVDVDFNSDCSFLSVTTFSFDICYLELYLPLISGGKLIVVPREVAIDGFKLLDSIAHFRPTHMQGTPATWQLLLDTGWENRESLKILIGGEAVKENLKDQLTRKGTVYNLYGPTETTIWSTIKQLQPNKKVSIGKPIANTSVYIVNQQLQLCPVNVSGEICISGKGLSRGYLNLPTLTEGKFIKNPYSYEEDERMYKTGDLGRWLPDGNIEYSRRLDDQVKIRGYRIELGEVETALLKSELVNQAVVLIKEDKENNKKLVAYYIPKWQIIKEKESELYNRQISSWKEIYETQYSTTEKRENEEFDINIWTDSFSGEPIADKQMLEWLEDIIDVILRGEPKNVLEIGCGSGLIYYQLAGKVNKYIGTDFSASSINQINERIRKGLRNYGPTELQICAAHEISLQENQQIDTVILNSVIQYFPGEDYMTEIIGKSISFLKGSGRIIIGDVRDFRLLKLFKGRLRISKLPNLVSVQEFKWLVEQDVLKEEELCFSPEYFYKLQSIYPQIFYIEIKWKQSSYINELTLYRYTVVLHIGKEVELIMPDWKSWKDNVVKENLATKLQQGLSIIALKDVPNPRLFQEQMLSKALADKLTNTVGDLVNAMSGESKVTEEVMYLIKIARLNGYHHQLLLNENPLLVNVLFHINPSINVVYNPFVEKKDCTNTPNTNTPLFYDINLALQKDIRSLLKESLPNYMVPSELVSLNQLPLTNNGKVDRKFLSLVENTSVVNKLNITLPQNNLQQTLANIWQELLGNGHVGINDNFFEIGGHSLLGTRAVSQIRKQLQVEISIKDLFLNPTIYGLSTFIEGQSKGLLMPAIVPQPRRGHIPLSFSQERLWFIDQLEGSLQYHLSEIFRLKGALNKKALASAYKEIIDRHEVLRTVIREDESGPYQHIKNSDEWALEIIDGLQYQQNPQALEDYLNELINEPFDLSKDYMVRAQLIELGDQEHKLLVTIHHIACDGWSVAVFVQELSELYKSFFGEQQIQLSPLALQYADYAIWQRHYLKGELFNKKIVYWKEKLEDLSPLQLPADFPRPAIQSTNGATAAFSINEELTEQLRQLSKQQGTTLFITLLTAYKVLLQRYSGQEDICIGTAVADRHQVEVENLIGFFVNTLALRSEVSGNTPFTELLQKVKINTLEAYEYQEVPFEKVVEVVVKERDLSRNPLFQVMIVWQNTPQVPEVFLGDVQLTREPVAITKTKFDISFTITETANGLQGLVEYCVDLFKPETIGQMNVHFRELLSSIVQQPEQKIGKLAMLTRQEERQLLENLRGKSFDYPKDKSIVDLFEEQVARTPGNIAVASERGELTYQELNEKSNQLARYLRNKGVKEKIMVPICLNRSSEMIIGILGILKAGGAYVPIDPDYPEERIRYMLEDTYAEIVISNTTNKSKLHSSKSIDIIELDQQEMNYLNELSIEKLDNAVNPKHLAYVIYTSGSTGKPKGVMIEHRSVINLISWHNDEFKVTDESKATSMAGVGFDAFGWELWPYLSAGASVYFIDDNIRLNSSQLLQLFKIKEISHSFISTALVQEFVHETRYKRNSLKFLLTGGDKLSQLNLEGIPYTVVNNYGPTEYTVVTSSYVLTGREDNTTPSIGKPIGNTIIRILNEQESLVSIGVVGELCVGGDGLARGYLNLKELTYEKFVNIQLNHGITERMYKTGDLARWLPDGNIEYIGRKDDQVKIRGNRIELGEIESVLLQSGLINQALVMVKGNDEGDKWLVAYVIGTKLFEKQKINRYLQEKLPKYMIPALWVELDSFPLTPNGKINKKALPEPNAEDLVHKEYVAPQTEIEAKLAEIWKELLHLEKVGIHDNFFELGGHSLLAKRMGSYIERNLLISIPIQVLFKFTTICELGKYLEIQLDIYQQEKESVGFKFINI